jgi:hypothetical protein
MKTACFFTYFGPGRVSIARFAPRQIPTGLRVYRPLAPGTWFNSVSYVRYRELYFAQLATSTHWSRRMNRCCCATSAPL